MRLLLIVLVFAYSPMVLRAEVRGAPDAGALLQQLRPLMQPAASPGGSGLEPGLLLEQADGSRTALPLTDPILVLRIRITGNTQFDTKTLLALVAHAEGQALTLAQLNDLAGLITKYYRSHGYPLSRAIIPAQTISSGLLRIEVIEARFGEIKLDNSSQVRDAMLQATLSNLHSGQAISQAELDYVLLLLSDMAAITVNAKLRPGSQPGTSDLLVVTEPGPSTSGNAVVDNSGDSYTGPIHMAGTFSVNNPLQRGDTLSLSVLSSGKGINFARVSYESVLNGRGTRMGGSYSMLNYSLGGKISSLQAHGSAQEKRLWLKQSLLRGTENNVYGQILYEGLKLRDHIDISQIQTDRSLENWTLNLTGDMRDHFLNGSINNWGLAWTTGRVGFDDAAAQLANAATASTQGRFSKWTVNLARLQGLSPGTTLYLKAAAQWANTNLDASQKFAPVGLSGVRAYDTGSISGDTGYLLSAEFRYALAQGLHGQLHAVAFIDSAYVVINKRPWVSGSNSATLSGAGLGLNWAGPSQWSVRTTIATPLGSRPKLLGTARSLKALVEASRVF